MPASRPVTTPLELMLASSDTPSDHVAVLPLMMAPFASFAIAMACAAPPTVMLDGERLTVTLETVPLGCGPAVTVTDMLPVTPDADAVTVAVPAPTAFTSPLLDTVATPALEVVQV